MQAIFAYLSVGDLFGLAGIGVMVAAFAANCSYQKRRALAQERAVQKAVWPASQSTQATGVAAHA